MDWKLAIKVFLVFFGAGILIASTIGLAIFLAPIIGPYPSIAVVFVVESLILALLAGHMESRWG